MTSQAKTLVIISGKGGTGKTSLMASYAVITRQAVLADCDVDAADLHLIMHPKIRERHAFVSGKKARIKPGHCTTCGKCEELCRFDAISFNGPGNGRVQRTFQIDPIACEGCGVCARYCAEDAIEQSPYVSGEWYISDTRGGPMVHARLNPGSGNSGKLVTLVRTEAERIARERKRRWVIADGSPGIGCSVIASITGASFAVAITEPTLSGEHDLERVMRLARHFSVPLAVCLNKWDVNPVIAQRIEDAAVSRGAMLLPRVPYDPSITEAQWEGKAVVEHGDSPAALAIRKGWKVLSHKIK